MWGFDALGGLAVFLAIVRVPNKSLYFVSKENTLYNPNILKVSDISVIINGGWVRQ